MLTVSCDLSRLNVERPTGASTYASYVLERLAESGEVRVVGRDQLRQAVGTFKCCGDTPAGIVYSVPVRDYSFDTDFLDPSLLPPLTPVFRDTNTLGFAQELRPGR